MMFKQYAAWVMSHVKADSEKPTDIVQALACLIATRLSTGGKLPVACGQGDTLDMDVVQAGILAGLEKIAEHDSTKGTIQQFLYPTIAGAMRDFAWQRENRVSDSRGGDWPIVVDTDEAHLESAMVTTDTPESILEANEAAQTTYNGITAAIAGMPPEDMALLMKDAQIGYNAVERRKWADEIGVTVGTLSMRLSRLRKTARDWAMNVQ